MFWWVTVPAATWVSHMNPARSSRRAGIEVEVGLGVGGDLARVGEQQRHVGDGGEGGGGPPRWARVVTGVVVVAVILSPGRRRPAGRRRPCRSASRRPATRSAGVPTSPGRWRLDQGGGHPFGAGLAQVPLVGLAEQDLGAVGRLVLTGEVAVGPLEGVGDRPGGDHPREEVGELGVDVVDGGGVVAAARHHGHPEDARPAGGEDVDGFAHDGHVGVGAVLGQVAEVPAAHHDHDDIGVVVGDGRRASRRARGRPG